MKQETEIMKMYISLDCIFVKIYMILLFLETILLMFVSYATYVF